MAGIGRLNGGESGDALSVIRKDLPRLSTPGIDTEAISRTTQKFAAGGIRKLRMALQAGLAKTSENPNVAALMKGRLLQSFGTGLEGIVGEARRGATSVELAEMEALSAQDRLLFDAEMRRRFAEARLLLPEQATSGGRLRPTTPISSRGGGRGAGTVSDPLRYELPLDPGFEQRFAARKVGRTTTTSSGSVLSRLKL